MTSYNKFLFKATGIKDYLLKATHIADNIIPITIVYPTSLLKKSLPSAFCIALCEGSFDEFEFLGLDLFGSKPKMINPRTPRNSPKSIPSVVSLPFCLAM